MLSLFLFHSSLRSFLTIAERMTGDISNLETLKRSQKSTRTKITITCNAIKRKVQSRGSRRAVEALLLEAFRLLAFATNLNEDLTQIADDVEVSEQQERHLEYVTTVAPIKALVEQYLRDRANDSPSTVLSGFAVISTR